LSADPFGPVFVLISYPFKDYDEPKTLVKQNCRSVSKAVTRYNADPLDVLKVEAESSRAVASAIAARAGYLPGVSLTGAVGSGGSRANIGVSADNGYGWGKGASLKAIEAEEAAAAARVGQSREDANRVLRSLEAQLASLNTQQGERESIAAQAKANFELFDEQYRAGQRTVMDVISVYETHLDTQADAAVVKYQKARVRLAIANERGTLVEGERI
jgi:adhesin transport system outer membrane protein